MVILPLWSAYNPWPTMVHQPFIQYVLPKILQEVVLSVTVSLKMCQKAGKWRERLKSGRAEREGIEFFILNWTKSN